MPKRCRSDATRAYTGSMPYRTIYRHPRGLTLRVERFARAGGWSRNQAAALLMAAALEPEGSEAGIVAAVLQARATM